MIRITLLFYVLFTVINVNCMQIKNTPVTPYNVNLLHQPLVNVNNAINNNDVEINLGTNQNALLSCVLWASNKDNNELAVTTRKHQMMKLLRWSINVVNEVLPAFLYLPVGLFMSTSIFMLRGSANWMGIIFMIANIVLYCSESHNVMFADEMNIGEDGSLNPSWEMGEAPSWSQNPSWERGIVMFLIPEAMNWIRFHRWSKLPTLPYMQKYFFTIVNAPRPPPSEYSSFSSNMWRFLAFFNSINPSIIQSNLAAPLTVLSIFQAFDKEASVLLAITNAIITYFYYDPNMLSWFYVVMFWLFRCVVEVGYNERPKN